MKFSLILATYGRSIEIDELLRSLKIQNIGVDNFEIIIVDQNDQISIDEVVLKYSGVLNIVHLKSTKKGLSYNRNIGISHAKGDYICFPDDDCTYYPDTLSSVVDCFSNPQVNAVFGAIRDRSTRENIIRQWPLENKKLTKYNFFWLYSSITMFVRKSSIRFNEQLGVGCYFGSCEDSDYAYAFIKNIGGCYYFSNVEVWHPKIGLEEFSREKNHSYGLGFGAFCASHKFDFFILRIYFMSLAFHLAQAVLAIFRLDINAASKRWCAFSSRVIGFYEYLMSSK